MVEEENTIAKLQKNCVVGDAKYANEVHTRFILKTENKLQTRLADVGGLPPPSILRS